MFNVNVRDEVLLEQTPPNIEIISDEKKSEIDIQSNTNVNGNNILVSDEPLVDNENQDMIDIISQAEPLETETDVQLVVNQSDIVQVSNAMEDEKDVNIDSNMDVNENDSGIVANDDLFPSFSDISLTAVQANDGNAKKESTDVLSVDFLDMDASMQEIMDKYKIEDEDIVVNEDVEVTINVNTETLPDVSLNEDMI